MELSGNLWEPTVTPGTTLGRCFAGTHGDGTLAQPPGWDTLLLRGGGSEGRGDLHRTLRTSDRCSFADLGTVGFRCVRTAPRGQPL